MTYAFIKDRSELKKFINVDGDFDMDYFVHRQDRIIKRYLFHMLGSSLLNRFQSDYDSGAINNVSEYKDAFMVVQTAVANLTYLQIMDSLNVNQSAGGYTVNRAEGKEVASQWRIVELKQSVWKDAFDALGELVEHVETNHASLTEYTQGTAFLGYKSSYLRDHQTFKKYVSALRNAWLFTQIRPIIERIESGDIPSAITPALNTTITDLIASEGDTSNYDAVIDNIRGAIAHRAMKHAFIELRLVLGTEGVTMFNQENTRGNTQTVWSASREDVLTSIKYHERTATTYMDRLQSLLNSGDVTGYIDPDATEAPSSDETYNPRNPDSTSTNGGPFVTLN
jgi:hypothetical protein